MMREMIYRLRNLNVVTRRRFRHLLLATPSILALIVVGWIAAGFATGKSNLSSRYAKWTDQALEERKKLQDQSAETPLGPEQAADLALQTKKSRMFAERTVQISNPSRYVLELANLLIEGGERARGEELLRGLVERTPPFPPVHLALARKLLTDSNLSASAEQEVNHHLRMAQQVGDASANDVTFELARLNIRRGRSDLTVELLKKLPPDWPAIRMAARYAAEAENAARTGDLNLARRRTLSAIQTCPDPKYSLFLSRLFMVEADRVMFEKSEKTRDQRISEAKPLQQRAEDILISIAPPTPPPSAPPEWHGYAPAHLQLAGFYSTGVSNEANNALVKQHLLLAAKAEDESFRNEAYLLLSKYYLRIEPLQPGKKDHPAIGWLQKLPAENPGKVFLAELYKDMGDMPSATREAKVAETRYRDSLGKNPRDVTSREWLVRSLAVQNQYRPALDRVREGIDIEDNPQGRKALEYLRSFVYRSWLKQLETLLPASQTEMFQVLAEAVRAAPDDAAFLANLNRFTDPKSQEGQKARAMLLEQIAKNQNAGLAHFVLGNLSNAEGNTADAVFHLELAYKSSSFNPVFANNLAWVLMKSNPPQLDRALQLIEPVVKAMPQQAELRHTRGVILLKMKRWTEAIIDLESGPVRTEPNAIAERHLELAEAYDGGNQKEIADRHRKLAQEARAGRKTP